MPNTIKKGDKVMLVKYDDGGWAKDDGLEMGEIYTVSEISPASGGIRIHNYVVHKSSFEKVESACDGWDSW